MAKIDKFLEMMTHCKAEGAVLTGDKPFLIVVEKETHQGSVIPRTQLRQVIDEITPAEDLSASALDTFQIRHQRLSSAFDIVVNKSKDTLSIALVPEQTKLESTALESVETGSYGATSIKAAAANHPIHHGGFATSHQPVPHQPSILADSLISQQPEAELPPTIPSPSTQHESSGTLLTVVTPARPPVVTFTSVDVVTGKFPLMAQRKRTLTIISLLLVGSLTFLGLASWQRSAGTGSNSTSANATNFSGTVNVELGLQTSHRTPEAINMTLAQRLAAEIAKHPQNRIFSIQCRAPFGRETLIFRMIYNRQERTLLKVSAGRDNQSYQSRVFRDVDDATIRDMAVNKGRLPSH